jgi:2'-5' RNA ligase
VVWAGCSGDLEKAAGLAGAVERAAERVGVPREGRPFVAHVTLGRVKSDRGLRTLQAAIGNQRQADFGRDEAGAFALYRSTLTPEGPVYEELERFALGA